MEARAIAKDLRVSPIRARLVSDMIRGKKASEALTILNNVNNNGADVATLYVKEARVDAGPVMKRHLFDSRSHIGHKDHRTSHIIITVATKN